MLSWGSPCWHTRAARVPPWPRAAEGVCVRSGTRQRQPWGSCLWGWVRRRVRRARGRAGRQWVRRARGSTRPLRKSTPCYVLCDRAARIRSLATSCGQALGFRHTARRRLGRAVCGGVGSRGRWCRVRWSTERCGRHLRCSSVGKVRWWGVAMAVGTRERRWSSDRKKRSEIQSRVMMQQKHPDQAWRDRDRY